jgi:alkaline phosphatase D
MMYFCLFYETYKDMKRICIVLLAFIIYGCGTNKRASIAERRESFVIAFGSCNKPELENLLWDDVLATRPDVWIWGGDNIYADTGDMTRLANMYNAQNQVPGYHKLRIGVPVIGTWDDHDYGLNDGGSEFDAKKESQEVFLDFMGVPAESPRRDREGVYTSHEYNTRFGSVKVLVLDTRFFRSPLTPDTETKKRFKPNSYGEGTILGPQQWLWLEEELMNSKAQFNIIVSSIQLLSNEHGFEGWGNFPHEVDRFKELLLRSGAKGVIVLSGDRHISEFSKLEVQGMSYPLVDFTSSGLTHAYHDFSGEPNPYRIGRVINTESFGVVKLNLKENKATFQIVGDRGKVLGSLKQKY